MSSVKCDVCQKLFTNCFSVETNQAFKCASSFYSKENESGILCHYGSEFDTKKFNISPSSSYYNKSGTICDCCIEKLMEQQEIQEDMNFDYWNYIR